MTPEEREQIKAEVLAELRMEFHDELSITNKKAPLSEVREKWFKGGRCNKESLMYGLFGSCIYWKVWDEIRRLTCYICNERYVGRLTDTETSNEIAEALCQIVFDLRTKYMQSKEDTDAERNKTGKC